MEPFVDFGLFEFFAFSGLAAIGRIVLRRPVTRFVWLAISVAAPFTLVVWSPTETVRWIATVALATTCVNVAVMLRARTGDIAQSSRIGSERMRRDATEKEWHGRATGQPTANQ
jgi:hypothetical protein